ncbi:hypothetical protein JCM3765_007844 [Sporobolomyces pararoseus]
MNPSPITSRSRSSSLAEPSSRTASLSLPTSPSSADYYHQSEPLLPPAYSPSTSRDRKRSRCCGLQSTARKRTNLFFLLVFLGILLISVRLWGDELQELEGRESRWESQLKAWREWATQGGRRENEELGWGWTGSTNDTLSVEDATGEITTPMPAGGGEKTELEKNLEVIDSYNAKVDAGTDEVAEEVLVEEVQAIETTQEQVSLPKWNVRPVNRNPSADSSVKYLSFENHSGFHNQRKSLVNALVLSRLLNRTLLLPPARLGNAIPWGPDDDLPAKLVFSEECKAGLHPDLPIASSPNSHLIASREACDDPKKWTYTSWDWLISSEIFAGRSLVDRWNASKNWFLEEFESGGLGLSAGDIHHFQDDERRSYQLYDSRETPTQLGLFNSRINLEDLVEGPLADKRLLQFGSLFSGSRLNLAKEKNQQEYEKTFNSVILENEGLEAISNEVRDRLGSYVAVHARTGSNERGSFFWKSATSNMNSIFRKLTHSVLGIKAREVDRMVRESTARTEARRARRSIPSSTSNSSSLWDDDLEEEEEDLYKDTSPRHLVSRSINSHHQTRAGRPAKPLSPSLHCRKPLWPESNKILSRLNTPLYIATDSRSPSTEPALRIFFDWFPCLFLLDDFISPTPGVSDEAVPQLVSLTKGGEEEWVSDWDGSELGAFLYPFLEAEIAARGVEIVGTPGSTFSSYAAGNLHEYYESRGLLAPWDKT